MGGFLGNLGKLLSGVHKNLQALGSDNERMAALNALGQFMDGDSAAPGKYFEGKADRDALGKLFAAVGQKQPGMQPPTANPTLESIEDRGGYAELRGLESPDAQAENAEAYGEMREGTGIFNQSPSAPSDPLQSLFNTPLGNLTVGQFQIINKIFGSEGGSSYPFPRAR